MSAGRAPHQPDARFGVAGTTAVEILTSTAVWFAIGRLLDLVLGTGPWITFIGACTGCWVGLYLGWSGAARREQAEQDDVDEVDTEETHPDATSSARSSTPTSR